MWVISVPVKVLFRLANVLKPIIWQVKNSETFDRSKMFAIV